MTGYPKGSRSMTEPWWNRRDFRKLFDDLDKEPEDILEMFEKTLKSFEKFPVDSEFEGSFFYGFSITQGPEGKPVIREFGNVKPSGRSISRSDVREPLVDTVYDRKHNEVRVVVDMPGVEPGEVSISVHQRSVRVRASDGDRRYEANVPLDVPVEEKLLRKTFNNGILELALRPKPARRVRRGARTKKATSSKR
jgi:HSP20 family protein